MKFSYNWLREMVPALDASAKDLGRLITIHTAECEGVEEFGELLAAVDAAKVVSVEAMGASHNRKAVVETARYGRKTVVCGAPNCRVGITTAYVPAGTTLTNGKTIGKITLEGVESDGMLASGAELGINADHTGIVEFEGALGLAADTVIEIDNKSLTHRPDLWGHFGMAREVAAITGKPLHDPVDMGRLPEGSGAIKVTVEDYKLCPRYSALVFENVNVGPSPLWLQARLAAVGLNTINNVVDVTNIILAELPQPMHAFDADKVRGGEIIVRPAKIGEQIAALNGESYELDPSTLVIADKEGPVAVAGVIGGADSAIGDGTTRIVLESANFNAISVRKTSVKLKLRTDASMRFEKAQDPENTLRGLARAVELLEQVCPGIRLVGGVVDAYQPPPSIPPIDLNLDWLDRKLGRAVPAKEVRRIFESLSFGVEESGPRVFRVAVPTWRATKDVSIKDDLVEEIGRMIGYGTIDPAPPLVAAKPPVGNPERAFHHQVRDMAAAQGFTEVYNYSFVNLDLIVPFGFDLADHVEVLNPIAADQTHLRTSLLPRIWRN
ncbi:MAG: phenylalanine--tRNA ligase subunit beta, partial [Bryobacteraceae bacterium]